MQVEGNIGSRAKAAMDRREWSRRTLSGIAGARIFGSTALAGQDADRAGKGVSRHVRGRT